MKPAELRKKSRPQLEQTLATQREKLRKLYFNLPIDKVKDVSQINNIKKDIARIITILKETDSKKKKIENNN